MKVLFVHEGYISKNGNELYSLHYNNTNINRYKYIAENVTFLVREESFDKNRKNQNLLDTDNFNFIGIKNYKNLKNIHYYFEVKRNIELAVIDTDYVVARLPGDLGNLAIKYAIKHKKKYMIELVGCAWDALWYHSIIGKMYAPFLFAKTRSLVKNAPFVLYVTKDYLQIKYPTIGYSSNISDVYLSNKNNFKYNKRINKSKVIILGTIGSFDLKYKGHYYVFKAISELKKQGYILEYQLVGSGSKDYLNKLIRKLSLINEIKFIGSLPHNEIFDWLNNIDIYIQPSNTEGLPRSLIEAMSESCICIGSNAGGIPELLPKSNIFKKKNFLDLVKVLKNVIESGEITREHTYRKSKEYSRELIEDKYIEFFVAFRSKK